RSPELSPFAPVSMTVSVVACSMKVRLVILTSWACVPVEKASPAAATETAEAAISTVEKKRCIWILRCRPVRLTCPVPAMLSRRSGDLNGWRLFRRQRNSDQAGPAGRAYMSWVFMRNAMNPAEKALWFVESHFARDISLDEVAAVAGVSRYHITRAFAAATGMPVMAYAKARRLSEA